MIEAISQSMQAHADALLCGVGVSCAFFRCEGKGAPLQHCVHCAPSEILRFLARSIRLKCFLGDKLLPMRAGWPFNGRRAPRRGRQAIRGRSAGIRSEARVGGRGRMSLGEKRGKTRAQMTLNGAAEFFPGAAGGSGSGKARGKRGETGHGRAQRKNSAVRRARPMRCGLRAEGRATGAPRRFRRLA